MANILIIDDSPTDVKIFSGALERAGHKVTSVATAEAGIDAAHKTKPDLVLMDVIMPGMNGFQATRSLTKDPETSAIPVLIVTTKSMETDRMWGMRQGAKDVLVKPVSEKDLVAHVNKHLPAGV
ncbi:MAG: response regulator [Xanthomonadaceae bacterium]|nr:response regulator [Xanthomonadaceae bacterium]MBU6476298.1 response regulator [Xanthomonadaceae bacterium]MDE2053397.1 response regulator [Xanthomonadaceae bacterium]MDE2224346.1 response regulator [Xanthomonadaceae bacterium]MDE2497472.1 response regulator [Xanthomonadaceae bacterium]